MADCKDCEGLGIVECVECLTGAFNFLHGVQCPTCAGELFFKCAECEGTGVEPNKSEK
jgi:DnaJ-class molecular chaperone